VTACLLIFAPAAGTHRELIAADGPYRRLNGPPGGTSQMI
jgi:hypothetical protein